MHDAKKAAVNLARKGRYGDTEIAHVERGERVVPMDFQEKMPKTMSALDMAMRAAGIDPARYTVAGTRGKKHPKTGAQEFFAGSVGAGDVADAANDAAAGVGGASEQDIADLNASIAEMDASFGVTGEKAEEETSILERAVKAITRASQLEKAEEFGQLVEQSLEERGINVDTGRPEEHGDMTGTGTGDMPGDGAGGSSDLTDEDRETPAAQSLPEDPGTDDQQPADPDYSLTVSRAAVTMPNIGELIAAYSRRSPGATMLTNIAAPAANPRVNPDTGVQMFAREDHFDRDWYLDQNPDVAAAGADPWEHYQSHGRNEGRLGNRAEQDARDEGYMGAFGEGRYAAWKDEQMEPFKDDGSLGDDLIGGSFDSPDDFSAPGGLGVLADRQEARDRGYTGAFGQGGYSRFLDSYYDHDNDPSTHWLARNDSNINRSGEDVGYTRELLRRAGYTGNWGAGGAGNWTTDALGQYGLDSTGTVEGDARAIYAAARRPPRPTWDDLPWWMRGVPDIASIDRNPVGTAGNATPAGGQNAIALLSGLTPDRRRRYVNTTNRRFSPGFAA